MTGSILCAIEMTNIHMGILVLLGLGVFGGAIGAWFFQKIRIPQVVGYIAFGIVVGKSGFGLIKSDDIENLGSFTWFALGVIGFLVGGELEFSTFRKYGKQFLQILLWEGLSAFILVLLGTFCVIYWLTGDAMIAFSAAVVFGAVASATDPASTVSVLWEYRARGVLTTTLTAIVALDDALAMTLYGIGTSVAEMLVGSGGSIGKKILMTAVELGSSVAFGLAAGLLMVWFIKFIYQKQDRMLAVTVGMLLLVIGIASAFGLDIILVMMAMGLLLVNLAPGRSQKLFELIRSFSGPIYVMFFVLVGARLGIGNMPGWLWLIVGLYVVGRSAGKVFGCWMGAKLSGAAETVQKYSGMGIFAQGGVAIGLSIMATHHMGHIAITETMSLGDAIVAGVTATTFIVQIIGPPLTKLSIKLAGESGKNITREDVLEELTVAEAVKKDIEPLKITDRIATAVEKFSRGEYTAYPVVDLDGNLSGVLTFKQLKDVLMDSDCWDWMVVADILLLSKKAIKEDVSLKKAMEIIREGRTEQMPVVKDDRPIGIIDERQIRKVVDKKMLSMVSGS